MIILSPGNLLKDLLKRLNFEIKEEIPLTEAESRLIETVNRKKRLKEILRSYRKIDVIKTKLAIIKALSFVKKIFNCLWEICKKLGTIFGACRFILHIVEQVNQLINNESRNDSFLFYFKGDCYCPSGCLICFKGVVI